MTNNPFVNGDIYYAVDAGMMNTKYLNPLHQQMEKTLQGSNLTTSTNLTVINSQNSVNTVLNVPGGASDGSLIYYIGERLFSGLIYSNPGVTSATAITESLPSEATVSKGSGIFDYQFFDNYDAWNSSVDLTKWTVTAGVTEDTAQLILSSGLTATRTALTNGTGSNNLQSYKYICTLLKWTVTTGTSDGGDTVQVYLNDGAVDTSVWSQTIRSSGGGGEASFTPGYALLEFFHDTTGKIVLVYLNGCYLTRYTYATTTLRIKYEEANTATLGTSLATLNVLFLGFGKATPTSTVTHTISADRGSNFETYTEADSHTFSTTGNYLQLKGVYTLSATETVLMKGWVLQIDK